MLDKAPQPPSKNDADAAAAAGAPAQQKPIDKHFVTAGTSVHKWSTYLGVDWVFNAFTGVSFAYWGKFSQSGQEYWSKPITNFFEKALTPIIKNAKLRATSVERGNMFMSIIAGGMFTIPPLLVLENNNVRKSFAKFYDRMIYGKDKVENDPELQAAYARIDETPKKDFLSGLGSRFVALSPLLATVLIPTTRKFTDKYWFDHVEHASEGVAKFAGFSPEKSFGKLTAADAAERWKFIHSSVAMDFGLGAPYAVLHAFFYNQFTHQKTPEKPKDIVAPTLSLVGELGPSEASKSKPENRIRTAAAVADRVQENASDKTLNPSL